MYERENIDESSNRHFQSMVSEWGNPPGRKIRVFLIYQIEGTRGTETSKYPEEKKSYEIP